MPDSTLMGNWFFMLARWMGSWGKLLYNFPQTVVNVETKAKRYLRERAGKINFEPNSTGA